MGSQHERPTFPHRQERRLGRASIMLRHGERVMFEVWEFVAMSGGRTRFAKNGHSTAKGRLSDRQLMNRLMREHIDVNDVALRDAPNRPPV